MVKKFERRSTTDVAKTLIGKGEITKGTYSEVASAELLAEKMQQLEDLQRKLAHYQRASEKEYGKEPFERIKGLEERLEAALDEIHVNREMLSAIKEKILEGADPRDISMIVEDYLADPSVIDNGNES
jgi:hypothetical protein